MFPSSRIWNKSRTQNICYCLLGLLFGRDDGGNTFLRNIDKHQPDSISVIPQKISLFFHSHHRKNLVSGLVNGLVFIMKIQCIFCEVGTEYFKYYLS